MYLFIFTKNFTKVSYLLKKVACKLPFWPEFVQIPPAAKTYNKGATYWTNPSITATVDGWHSSTSSSCIFPLYFIGQWEIQNVNYLLALLWASSNLHPASAQRQMQHCEPDRKQNLMENVLHFIEFLIRLTSYWNKVSLPSAQSSPEWGRSCTAGQSSPPTVPSVKSNTLHQQTKHTKAQL